MKQNILPILFTTENVQAILEYRKRKTKRLIKQAIDFDEKFIVTKETDTHFTMRNGTSYHLPFFKPRFEPGQYVWVREKATVVGYKGTTSFHYAGNKPAGLKSVNEITIEYDADGHRSTIPYPVRLSTNIEGGKKLPYGIFKEAARIFLKINDVLPMRIQSITSEDAILEGIKCNHLKNGAFYDYIEKDYGYINPINSFASLWNSINGKDAWIKNNWVWDYDFTMVYKSLDPELKRAFFQNPDDDELYLSLKQFYEHT